MDPRSIARIVSVVLLLSATGVATAESPCACGPKPTLGVAYANATDVVLARVEQVDGPYHEDTDVGEPRTIDPGYQVRILARWKGRHDARAVVRTALDPSQCAYPLIVGDTFLLYAERQGTSDTLRASACTRSSLAALAIAEMKQLDRLHPRSGTIPARLAVPDRCPVHSSIPLRQTGTRSVYQLPLFSNGEYERLRATRFPYAALQFENSDAGFLPEDGLPAITCALCRENALDWCRRHGAKCPLLPRCGMCSWYVDWPGFEAQHDQRVRLPKGVSGFYYDDGRRLRYDSLTGNLTRYVEGYGDTTIQVRLGTDENARIYREIVDSGFFQLAPVEQWDEPRDAFGSCDLVEFCAASDSSERREWWSRSCKMSEVASRSKVNRLIEEIQALLEGRPEYRALPPLPKGL